jgi:beta-lactamase superfamily II metal-dependent hydrolase
MKKILLLVSVLIGFYATEASTQDFEIYLIDVEGGGATLFVSPAGQTLLIDTGNGGQQAARDAGRIISAMRDAGVSEINYLVTTHWHGDHYGAMQELASQVPVQHFIDHGPSVESNDVVAEFLNNTYRTLVEAAEHTVVTPGDRIPLESIDVRVITAANQVISQPLQGGGVANSYCSDFTRQQEDKGENAQSVGIIAQFGAFRVLHLGDLTANTEFELMCPSNPIGTVDLFVVTHHGLPTSNMEVVVHAIEARAAIMNNGTRKGGDPEVMEVLHSAPGLEDLWQLHFSQLSGQEYTVPGLFIANGVDDESGSMPIAPMAGPVRGLGVSPAPVHNGEAHWLKVSARTDGSFTVINSRNGFTKEYR